MPFASFKNLQKRHARLHKERSQPERRRHLGILPKKQDFIKRARDKEDKDKKVKELRRKALDKNEDEFYFAMHRTQHSEERGHIPLLQPKVYSSRQLCSFLAIDIGQLRNELQLEVSRIRKLEARQSLLLGDPRVTAKQRGPAGRRTVFAATVAEARAVKQKLLAEATSQMPISVLGPSTSGGGGGDCEVVVVNGDADAADDADTAVARAQQVATARLDNYTELQQRLERAALIRLALSKREAKEKLMKNSSLKYNVERKGNAKRAPVYKFEFKRKR